jgi:dihydroorotate dehydrogenase
MKCLESVGVSTIFNQNKPSFNKISPKLNSTGIIDEIEESETNESEFYKKINTSKNQPNKPELLKSFDVEN